jgi:hypothetical protein
LVRERLWLLEWEDEVSILLFQNVISVMNRDIGSLIPFGILSLFSRALLKAQPWL